MNRHEVDMNSEPIIVLKNVSKTYTLYKNDHERFRALFKKPRKLTTHKALDNISLEIRKGEAVGIMGDNGGGKSTLLKHITGVTFPDEGEIRVNGMVAALLELTAGFASRDIFSVLTTTKLTKSKRTLSSSRSSACISTSPSELIQAV